MSIKEKLEMAQTSQVNFEISAAELAEFVKQLATDQGGQKSVPVVPKVQNSPTAPKATPVPSKMEQELQEKIEKLTARVSLLKTYCMKANSCSLLRMRLSYWECLVVQFTR